MNQEATVSHEIGEPKAYPDFLGVELQLNQAQGMAEAQCRELVRRYLAEHQFCGDLTPGHSASFFAIARYQSGLEQGRKELEYEFSASELMDLASVFGNQVFDPSSLEWFADDYSIGAKDDLTGESDLSQGVIATLHRLSTLGRFALADVLERIWHVEGPRHPDRPVHKIAKALGLKLRG